ncbi:hypothetical protein evm_014110 [Chilo suppressalis]|nr:hypothetical protein evm_014110 [Chilo suppressalis]
MKVSSLIASLEKEKTFYEKVLLKLDTNADEKIIVYIKSILDNIKICSKAWKDINKAGSFLKKVKEKSMLDLIRESKDDAKLPYNDKLNYKTPVFYNFDENVEKINDDTFYGPTKDDILESLQYKKTFNSLNGDNMQNLKINESSEMVLSYAKEIILPSDEIVEILPIKSYGNIQKQTEHQTEQNTYFEPIATTITNLEPQKNVDEKHEENMDQHNIIENSPVTYQTFFENLIEDMKTSYYKINYPDKDLFDYQEEYSLKSLPVNNSLEDLVQLKSTNELYNYSPPGSSKDEQDLFYKNSTPSTSRDQSYLYLPSTSTNTNTDLSSFKPQDIPPFNGDVNQYNSSDSLSSDASNFSKEHSDGGLEKKLHADFITGHKEQITDQNDSLLQKNMIGRRSKSELFNGVRDRSARKKSKNKSNRKRSNSLPCLRNKEEFLKYYNVPHENNFYYDSALGISLDTSYDSTPEDCLFDLYTDSDQTERYNAVNLLNTWVDIKKLDSEGDMVIEDDNQTIKNDSNDNEIFNNNERRSETLNNEDEKEDLLSKENIKYTEIKGLEVKKSDEKIALIPGEINQSDIIKSNDQNLNILQLEDDKHIENQVTKNESYGSEANAIDKSIVNIKEQTDNLATINFNLNENSNNTTLINTESIKVTNISESNSFKDPKVSPTVLEVLNESKEINIGDNFFKSSSVEDLDIIDTPGLQLSDTIDESNLKNPRSPNENNFVTIIVNQQDLNNSKEKRLTKLNSEFVNSPVNNSSVVKNDVSDSNQIDMLSKNAPSINILEQVITSTLKDDSLPSTMLKQIENLPLKHDNLPSKSVEQVIKSPIKVLKDDKSPSKTSEQINILLSKDDSLPSKVSEQVIKTPAKISEQVIKSPQKVSKEDNLLSKGDSLPSKVPEQAINVPSITLEQGIKPPQKVSKDDNLLLKDDNLLSKGDSLPSKISEQVIKPPSELSEQVIRSTLKGNNFPSKILEQDMKSTSKISEQAIRSPLKDNNFPPKISEQAVKSTSKPSEQAIKSPSKISEQVIKSPLKDNNLPFKVSERVIKSPSKDSEEVIKPPSRPSEQVIKSPLNPSEQVINVSSKVSKDDILPLNVSKADNLPLKISEQVINVSSKVSKDNNLPLKVSKVDRLLSKVSEQAVKSTSKPSEQAIKSPSKISEQVIKSPLKDNNLPFKVSERVIKSPSKDSEEVIKPPSRPSEQVIKSPLNPSEQVINVSSKVSKDDILPLNVSKADNLPLKISEQVINVSSKVSKDNNLPLKVSKVDRLLSKVSEQDMKSPSKPSEQAIKSPSKISEQVIRSPLKDNNFPSKISEQAAKPPSKLSEQVMNSPTKVPEQVIKTPSKSSEQAVKPPSKLSEQVMKSPSKVPEQVIKSTSKPSEQAAKPPSKLSEQVIKSPLKENNLRSKSSNEIKNSNSNNSARVSGKSPAEKVNQENLKNAFDKNKNASSAQNAKEQKPINKNATKPAEKEKNKPSTIRITFGFSRR